MQAKMRIDFTWNPKCPRCGNEGWHEFWKEPHGETGKSGLEYYLMNCKKYHKRVTMRKYDKKLAFGEGG